MEISDGDEAATDEVILPAEPARAKDKLQIAAAAPEKTDDAPPAPMLEEKPSAIGPAQDAALSQKIIAEAPARQTPKKPPGNPAVQTRGRAARGSSGGTTMANYRSCASLSYPSSALRDHVGGRVALLVDVDENGRATGVAVKQTSGRADLDAAAIACAR